MKIAWIANGTEGYGIARAATERMKQVRAAGHEAVLCTVASGRLVAQAESLGFSTHVLGLEPARGMPGRGLRKLAHLPQAVRCTLQCRAGFADLLRGLEPDVVHVVQPGLLAAGAWAAKKAGAAAVWEMPNAIQGRLPFGLVHRGYQAICNQYRVFPIANSAYTASTLGPTRVPAVVIYPATDVEVFDPANVEALPRAAFGVPDAAMVAVVCARMTPSKGQEQIVRALAIQRRQSPAVVHVVFVGGPLAPGDEAFVERLQQLAEELAVSDRVIFAGPSAEVARFHAMADFSISFRIDPEPFGLSIIESMLMRKPPIVHALGGPKEIVEHGVSGWHVLEPTPEALATVIATAAGDAAEMRRRGDAARTRALELYDNSQQIEAYLAAVRAHAGLC